MGPSRGESQASASTLNFESKLKLKKKFWEELIAYVPLYDTDRIEHDASNNSSIVACEFVTAVTFYRAVA
jgi:hypothetical protein